MIRRKSELRNSYWNLLVFRQLCFVYNIPREKRLLGEKVYKDCIREYFKWQEKQENELQWRAPLGDPNAWDRVMTKYEEPYVMTQEQAEEYIESHWEHWYDPYGDGRDCTGVWFTSGISCFPIPSRGVTIVYHWKSCDV